MTFPEFLRRHHACLRGAAYVLEVHGGNPMSFWNGCRRGDWLAWMLDAAHCESTHLDKQLCHLPYNVHEDALPELPEWWSFVGTAIVGAGYDGLGDYLDRDKHERWVDHADKKTMDAWRDSATAIQTFKDGYYSARWKAFAEGGFLHWDPPVKVEVREHLSTHRERREISS